MALLTLAAPSVFGQVMYSVTDLGVLPGFSECYANGINNNGQVVGRCSGILLHPDHAFLYDGKQMWDLNNLIPNYPGWNLDSANAINDEGQIVARGTNPSGQTHAFLLNPLPSLILNLGSTPALTTNGISLVLQGPSGNYVIEASSDICSATNWQPSMSYSSTNSPFYYHFTDTSATNHSQRFYRAAMQ